MKSMLTRVLAIAAVAVVLAAAGVVAQDTEESAEKTKLKAEDKLVVVWTSGDREVALSMVFMYVGNAPRYGWWDDITFIIWGPSAKLLAEDKVLQGKIKEMGESGIKLLACKGCADMYGLGDKLEELGIEVKYIGDVLTYYIKEGRHVLTF